MENPLILTLMLDAASQAHFNALRKAHFPPERNYLDAHLTLFHALPATEQAAVEAALEGIVDATSVLGLRVGGLLSLGKGVAYALESEPLKALHRCLQKAWEPWLSPQDRQGLRPHITVQNKVAPNAAKRLKAALEINFVPFQALGTGFCLWEYCGGPWRLQQEYAFRDSQAY